jgi:hypothetical protein
MAVNTTTTNPSKQSLLLHATITFKLSRPNHRAWKRQVTSLLSGIQVMGHIDGTTPSENPTTTVTAGVSSPNPEYTNWFTIDQLIINLLLSSMTEADSLSFASYDTARTLWVAIEAQYANTSRSHVMSIKNQIQRCTKGDKSITDYLFSVKSLADELAVIDKTLSDDDLTLYILNGLGSEYRDIAASIRTRERPFTFEELHSHLLAHDEYIRRESQVEIQVPTANFAQRNSKNDGILPSLSHGRGNSSLHTRGSNHGRGYGQSRKSRGFNPRGNRPPPRCQYCSAIGHIARYCPEISKSSNPPMAQYASASSTTPNWVFDTGASHHVANSLNNMHIHSEYDGPEEVQIGDGTGLKISHVGSTTLPTQNTIFNLKNILCVPHAKHNLISVSKFCKSNSVYVEFHSSFFCVKDQVTGAVLMRGPSNGDLYIYNPNSSSPTALSTVTSTVSLWHARFGHPSPRVLTQMLSNCGLSRNFNSKTLHCNSCSINKSHKLPFSLSSIQTFSPFELIFSDVWGPSPVTSINGYKYYLVFVDHFTRYTWIYPLKNKTDVAIIFPQFHSKIENFFSHKVKSIYTDGGTEYFKLKPYFNTHGISHYISPPYTPEHIGIAERKHRHIVETALTLLSHSSVPQTFWCYAFQMAVHLINRMPTPRCHNKCPHEILFCSKPNYLNLRVFGSLCYPWLRPYSKHKLSNRSMPCVFLGPSNQHHAYQCYHIPTKKLYLSRHVVFHESIFPFTSTVCDSTNPSPPSSTNNKNISISRHPHILTQLYPTIPPPNPPPIIPQNSTTSILTPL